MSFDPVFSPYINRSCFEISLHNTKEQQEESGVFEDLIRISVGIEDIEDFDFNMYLYSILSDVTENVK